MANFIMACLRDPDAERTRALEDDIVATCHHLTPDHLPVTAPDTWSSPGLVRAVYPSSRATLTADANVCLGLLAERVSWAQTGGAAPEGSFAIARADNDRIELLSDVVASRTIWYFQDESIFAASTSQRALVMLLRSFDFNENTVVWVLSTGAIGPGRGWDSRIRRLGPDTTVALHRRDWRLTEKSIPVKFQPATLPREALRERLVSCLQTAIGDLNIDYRNWTLPLSGGVDSRALLYLLPDRERQDCVTWGGFGSENVPGTDAFIAPKVAAAVGARHRFLEIPDSADPIEAVLHRFLMNSEGRVDHLSGYLDGFALWKALYDDGVSGIIRGDTAFTARPVASEEDVVTAMGFSGWDSFQNVPAAADVDLPAQALPDAFARKENELLEDWRDRLMRQLRIPVVIAALNQLKSAYVEIANPLLFRSITDFHTTIPHELRTSKRLFKSLFEPGDDHSAVGPILPFADYPAVTSKYAYLGTPAAIDYFQQSLDDRKLRGLVPDAVISLARSRIAVRAESDETMRRRMISMLAPGLRRTLKRLRPATIPRPVMDFNLLAFRILTIGVLADTLSKDARTLSRNS